MNCDETLRQLLSLLGSILLSIVSNGTTSTIEHGSTERMALGIDDERRPAVSLQIDQIRLQEKSIESSANWIQDSEVSWYGPNFYGNRTACGLELTTTLRGVAHRSLPCGTLVDFRFEGVTIRIPVIDRGPYVQGRSWDLTGGACQALQHCFTGPIEWRLVK